MTDDATPGDSKLDELMAVRRGKVARLRDDGIEPFKPGFDPTHTLAEVVAAYDGLEAGAETGDTVRVAGRVMAKRDLGRLAFLELREDRADLQLFVVIEELDERSRTLLEDLDVGDWVGAEGEVMVSKRGELSVRPVSVTLLSKSLRPLPDKWHGLKDVEQRYRQREVDLLVNDESREVFEVRSQVLRTLRTELDDRGFTEVETPMLHPIPGGAAARPFVTHHNTLDMDLYLRIAPELYLKRLVAGGFSKVYEINRSFRNEGMSPRHNPEFTMLESYEAYADHEQVMALTEELVRAAATATVGSTTLTYQGRAIDLTPPYPRRPLLELAARAAGEELSYDQPIDELRSVASRHGVDPDPSWGAGKLVVEIYEQLVEGELWDPVFVTEHPIETSPLARRHRSKPHVTERFELLMVGREHANGFTELIDPDDQRERFEAQAAARRAGDEEAMEIDEAYLRAIEIGLPPTGGLGVGIDRLVMLLANVDSIRDVILFPTLRPET